MISDILTAAKQGDISVVEHIIHHSPRDLRKKDKSGWSAIHIAAGCGHLDIVQRLLAFSPLLLNKRTATSHSSPLYIAAYKGRAAVAESLLRGGAAMDIRDSQGNTPLHAAMYWGHEDIAIMLMHNGAPVDVANAAGKTPQESIVYNREKQLNRYRDQPKLYGIGDKVDVNYQNLGNWFVGKIMFIGLTGADVDYIDGEVGVDIPFQLLRPHGTLGGATASLRRLQAAESVDNMLLYVGAKIEAQYHGEGPWFPGAISRVRVEGTFDIQFDDGDKEEAVHKVNVRLYNSGSVALLTCSDGPLGEPTGEFQDATEDRLHVGLKVRCNYQDNEEWTEGIITGINDASDAYDIMFDSGERESNVPLVLIDYLLVGASVECRYHGGNVWLPGVVMRVLPDGKYDVDYDDGSHETGVPRAYVRLYRARSLP